mmetsp:Transcript_13851/g.22104  ORF Transcript_13851/g.22104 Transcript_13851/m.22104 type:complete len:403 (-) Transcript_13851:310-1518(-)
MFGAIGNGFKALGNAVERTVTAPVRVTKAAVKGDWNGAYDAMKDVPIVSDAIDIGEGIKEGDMKKIAMGTGGLVLTAATGGAGGVATAGAKGVAKNVARRAALNTAKNTGKSAAKKTAKQQVKQQIKKAVKKEVKAQVKHEMKVEGKIITACLLLEQPKVLETIIRVFYRAGKAAGPYVLDAIEWCVENDPDLLISQQAAEVFGEAALRLYEDRQSKKKKRRCLYDHQATERISMSLLKGLQRLVRQKFEAKFSEYVVKLCNSVTKYQGLIKDFVETVKKTTGSYGKRVVKITGMAGWYLDRVDFIYSDGTRSHIGKTGGRPQGVFELQPDEYIVKVLSKGFHQYQGCGVLFLTNKGRNYAMRGTKYNEVRNQEQLFTCAKGAAIIGLQPFCKGVINGVAPK